MDPSCVVPQAAWIAVEVGGDQPLLRSCEVGLLERLILEPHGVVDASQFGRSTLFSLGVTQFFQRAGRHDCVDQGILPWPASEATAACSKILRQWVAGRGGDGAAEDSEAIAKVRSFLEAHGSSRFEGWDAVDEARVINRAGFWRENNGVREYICLREAWKNEVCAGMDAARVAKVLASRGLLLQDSQGKNSVPVHLPAGMEKVRCYVITAAIFDAETGN